MYERACTDPLPESLLCDSLRFPYRSQMLRRKVRRRLTEMLVAAILEELTGEGRIVVSALSWIEVAVSGNRSSGIGRRHFLSPTFTPLSKANKQNSGLSRIRPEYLTYFASANEADIDRRDRLEGARLTPIVEESRLALRIRRSPPIT
jgi:hypothetical protein